MNQSRLIQSLLTSLFFLALIPSVFAQGPWTQKKKAGFAQFQATVPFGTYEELMVEGQDENQSLNRSVLNMDFGIYANYGITDKITVFTNIPFKYVATKGTTDSLYNPILLEEGGLFGLSNLHLGVKYGLLDKKVKLATSFQTNLNTSNTDLGRGLATGYQSNSFGLFAHVGGSFAKRFYSFADLGYNFSTNNYSDYINVFFEFGYKPIDKRTLWLILNVSAKESMNNGSFFNENLAQTGLYPNDQQWIGYSLKAMYETEKKIGFTFSTAGALSANYVGLVGAVSVGVYKKW